MGKMNSFYFFIKKELTYLFYLFKINQLKEEKQYDETASSSHSAFNHYPNSG